MPRPGQRPYECVRRAWHSERHQPIRGSLIQEIFRIANEIHSPTTKKNKEWQEKLPIVVLKAEEIMYSKANSEADYMDLKTLRDRTNDAINTIIRRHGGSEETGEFLQPCIEAALQLGCISRRASRSQRNNHPKGYLTGNVDLGNAIEANPRVSSSLTPHYSNILRKESQNFVVPINSCVYKEMPFLSSQKLLPLEPSFQSKSFPVYPLYYGLCPQPVDSQQKPGAFTSIPSINDNSKMGIPHDLSMCRDQNKSIEKESLEVVDNPPESECDLSLRLGSSSVQEVKDVGSGSSQVKNHVIGSYEDSKEALSLYCGSNGGSIGEVDLMLRKRKATEQIQDQWYPWQRRTLEQAKDQWCPWQKNLLPSYINGGTRTAGL